MVQIDPNIQVGGRFAMGNWGGEEMNWIVIHRDGNEVLALNAKIVDLQPQHDADEEITWEHCRLRRWLNRDFYDKAFSSEEKQHILEYCAENPDNPVNYAAGGGDTVDKVFLLSVDEVYKYIIPMGDTASQDVLACPASASVLSVKKKYYAAKKVTPLETRADAIKSLLKFVLVDCMPKYVSAVKVSLLQILVVPINYLWNLILCTLSSAFYALAYALRLKDCSQWLLRSPYDETRNKAVTAEFHCATYIYHRGCGLFYRTARNTMRKKKYSPEVNSWVDRNKPAPIRPAIYVKL